MSRKKRFILNPETLVAELREEARGWGWNALWVTLGALVLFLLFMWLHVYVLEQDLPKTAILKRRNAYWASRVERMKARMDRYEEMLGLMELRDDRVYRSVYGMDEIPQAVRNSGFGGQDRYAALAGTALEGVGRRMDLLEKRVYIQSKSFEDVWTLQLSAGDMAAHIPAIAPMNTDPSTYRMSSPFGYRSDPILGVGKRHTGMDFACPPGNPVYATGDGVVVKVAHEHKGYGNHIEIDHGFGYMTRYAHLSTTEVEVGQHVSRGDFIGLSGRSGRITGPHLHYEVLYRKDYVNPALYMDLTLSPEDYAAMVRKPEGQ